MQSEVIRVNLRSPEAKRPRLCEDTRSPADSRQDTRRLANRRQYEGDADALEASEDMQAYDAPSTARSDCMQAYDAPSTARPDCMQVYDVPPEGTG